MDTRTRWTLTAAAGIAWLVVAGYGFTETKPDDTGWEGPFAVYMVALIIGAALTVITAALVTPAGGRRRLRTAGLIVGGVGVLSTIVAWALPLWMALLGIGLALIAGAAGVRERRALIALAAAQALGFVALFAGIAAEVGETDSYGDYPAAGGIALVVTAVVTIAALVDYARTARAPIVNV
jgi:hypothetical protein